MRIIILTVDHLYANKVVKDVVSEFSKDVKLIIESDALLHNKSLLKSLKKYYMVSGLKYIFYQALKLSVYKYISKLFSLLNIGTVDAKFFSYKRIAKELNIPVEKIFNVNFSAEIKKIKKQKPDLIVSILFNQLLGEEVICLPGHGVLNIHPAYLPDYKGVSPVFWALTNSERNAGVSIHNIDQGIDTGLILARKKLKIEKGDTEDSLYWKLISLGSPLLISVIEKIKEKRKINGIKNKGGRYFSLPTKKAVNKYLKKRKTFFKLNDILY